MAQSIVAPTPKNNEQPKTTYVDPYRYIAVTQKTDSQQPPNTYGILHEDVLDDYLRDGWEVFSVSISDIPNTHYKALNAVLRKKR